MMHADLTKTLKRQRATLEVEPIHAQAEPVCAYAKQIAKIKGEPFSVVTIPEGSAAHRMGYRFVSIPDTELPHYLANGAALLPDNAGAEPREASASGNLLYDTRKNT